MLRASVCVSACARARTTLGGVTRNARRLRENTRRVSPRARWLGRPLSLSGVNNFGGKGVTIIDSLDTLYVMGLEEEFKAATEWVGARSTATAAARPLLDCS